MWPSQVMNVSSPGKQGVPTSSPRVIWGLNAQLHGGTPWVHAAVPAGRLYPHPGWTKRGTAGTVRVLVPLELLCFQPGVHLRPGLSLTPQQDPGAPVSTSPPRDARASLALLLNWTKGDKGAQFLEMVPLLSNRTAGQLGPRMRSCSEWVVPPTGSPELTSQPLYCCFGSGTWISGGNSSLKIPMEGRLGGLVG